MWAEIFNIAGATFVRESNLEECTVTLRSIIGCFRALYNQKLRFAIFFSESVLSIFFNLVKLLMNFCVFHSYNKNYITWVVDKKENQFVKVAIFFLSVIHEFMTPKNVFHWCFCWYTTFHILILSFLIAMSEINLNYNYVDTLHCLNIFGV